MSSAMMKTKFGRRLLTPLRCATAEIEWPDIAAVDSMALPINVRREMPLPESSIAFFVISQATQHNDALWFVDQITPSAFDECGLRQLAAGIDLIIMNEVGGQLRAPVGHAVLWPVIGRARSEEHTSELQSLMRISYAVFC